MRWRKRELGFLTSPITRSRKKTRKIQKTRYIGQLWISNGLDSSQLAREHSKQTTTRQQTTLISFNSDHIEKKRRIERRREEEEQQQDLEEEIERRRLGQLSDELCRIFFILGKQKKQPPFYMKRGENYKVYYVGQK